MAACVPTLRPFVSRAWRTSANDSKENSGRSDPFISGGSSIGRNRTPAHRRVGSNSDLALDSIDVDAESRESQQGIVRTVEVSMKWKQHPRGAAGNRKDTIVPREIAESECACGSGLAHGHRVSDMARIPMLNAI